MPGTSANIETSYVEAYKAGFQHAFQQTESVMEPYVGRRTQEAEYDYFDRLGVADEMAEDTTRYGDNPQSEIEHDRRRVGLKDYELGKYVEPKDLMRVLMDPTNEYTQAMVASGKRKIDDIIVDGFFGTAYTGRRGDTAITFVSAPASGKIKVGGNSKGHSNPITTAGNFVLGTSTEEGIAIAHDYKGHGVTPANTGLTLEKLKALRFTMMRIDAIRQDTLINLFIGSRQFEDLLGIDEVINGDYATRRRLEEGQTTSFMGFRFIHNERLPVDASGYRRCIAMASPQGGKQSTILSMAKALSVDAWHDTGKKKIPYVYMKLSAEAVRSWGELSGEIKCVEP